MGIFIANATKCALCGETIVEASEFVPFPSVRLRGDLAFLAGAPVHRRCLISHPSRELLSSAWLSFWRETASGARGEQHEDDGRIFFSKPRHGKLAYANSRVFLNLEEPVGRWQQLVSFLRSEGAELAFDDARYTKRALSEGRVELTVATLSGGRVDREGKWNDHTEMRVQARHPFAASDWRHFTEVRDIVLRLPA